MKSRQKPIKAKAKAKVFTTETQRAQSFTEKSKSKSDSQQIKQMKQICRCRSGFLTRPVFLFTGYDGY